MFHSDRNNERSEMAEPFHKVEAGERTSLFDPVALAGGIWQRRGLIVLATVLGVGLAGAYAFSKPKTYTGVAQLVLDPRDLNIVQNDVTVAPTGMSTDATIALVESQIAVMTSNAVLERIVSKAGLTADPEFNGTRSSLLSGLSRVVGAFFSSDEDAVIRDRQLLTVINLAEHVKAVRNPNSFVINLSVTSEDPEKAARLANMITESFIAEQGRAQSEVARRATTAITARLAELRQRVVAAEDEVERYKAENKLVGVGGRLIDDDYITRINSQLADVRAQITALDVRAQSLKRASVNDVVEGSFPEGLNSETLQRLRQTYTDAAQNAAVLSTRLGPRHPQRIGADEAVATARRAIQTELGRIVASAQTELARARETEADLTRQIDGLRSRQIETSGSFVRLRELEREVDASRAVYEAYLLRARQTSEQESLNTANVRVISDATVPLQPSSLSRKIVMAAGGVAGLGLGVMLAALGAMLAALRGGTSAAGSRRTRGEAHSSVAEETGAARAMQAEEPSHDAAPLAEGWPLRGAADETAERATMPLRAPQQGAEKHGAEETERDAPTEFFDASMDDRTFDAPPTPWDETQETGEFDENDGDLDRRRAALRERIRAIGLRRSGNRAAMDADVPGGEGATPGASGGGTPASDATRERISLTMTAARQRRNLLVQPSP